MAPKDPSATATRRRQRQRGWLGAIAGGLKRALDPFGLFVNRREPREDKDETSSSSQEQSDSHHREDVGEEVVKLGEQQQEQERVGAEGQRRSAGEGEGGEGEGEGDSGEEMSDLAAAGNAAAAAVAVGGRGDDWREVAAAAEGRLEASQGGEEREEEMEDLLVNNAAMGDFRDRKGDQQREKADQELELIHKGLLQPLGGMGEGEGGGEMDEGEEAEEGEQEEGEEYGGGAVGGASEELTAAVMDVAFGVQAGDGADGEGGGTGGVGKVQGPATRQLRERIHRRKRQQQQQQLMQQGEMRGQEQEQLMQQREMQGQGQEQEQQGRVQQVVVASSGEEGRVVQQGQAGVLQSALHEPLGGGVRVGGSTSPVTRYPMDVFEDDTSYELQADVPGMSEHDVMVEVDAHSLVVEGTHVDRVERQQHMVVPRVGPEPHGGASAGAAPAPPPGPGGRSMAPQPAGALAAGGEASDRPGTQTTRRTVRLERQRRRHFRRTFRLPHDVDPTAITASLLDGVLIVRLAKATAAPAARGNGNVGAGGGGANRMLPPELAAAAETAAACVLRDLGGEIGPGAGVRRTAGGEGGEPPKPKRRRVRVDRLPAAVVDPYDIVLAVEVAEAAAAEGVEPADGEEEDGGCGEGCGGDDVAAVGEEVGMVGAGAGGGGDGGEGGGSGSVSTVGEELGVGVGGVDGGEGGNEEEARRGAMLAEAVAAGALEPLPTAEAVAVTSPAAPAANYGAAVVSYDSPDKRERWEGDEVPRSDVGIGEVGKGVGVGGGGGGGVPPLAPVTPRPAKGADTQGQ